MEWNSEANIWILTTLILSFYNNSWAPYWHHNLICLPISYYQIYWLFYKNQYIPILDIFKFLVNELYSLFLKFWPWAFFRILETIFTDKYQEILCGSCTLLFFLLSCENCF